MTPLKIIDIFSEIQPPSKRHYLRKQANKLCAECGCNNPRPEKGVYCETHREANRVKAANWYSRKKEVKNNELSE